MSKQHAARLLGGRLKDLHMYGPGTPWLYNVDAAARLLQRTSRSSHSACSPIMVLNKDESYGEILRQLCNAITEYLGVSEVIDSLDSTKQKLCCLYHYLRQDEAYSQRCIQSLEGPRRPELPLDWAILTALHTGDYDMATHLLESQRFQLHPNPNLSASLQYCAAHNLETTFQLFLNAGVDINTFGHASIYGDSEWNFGSALEAACAAGSLGIVKICLSPHHNLYTSGDFYESGMTLATLLDDHEIGLTVVKWLMSRWSFGPGRRSTISLLFQSLCRSGNVDLGIFIYENDPFDLNVICSFDDSPLGIAVEHGHANMVMYVLSLHRRCMETFPHREAKTRREVELVRAMRRAARFGQAHIASLLWDELDSWSMQTPLYLAARLGHTSMIEFLLSKGLDLMEKVSANDPQTIGEHALIRAAKHGHKSTIRFLLGIGIRTPNLEPLWCVEK